MPKSEELAKQIADDICDTCGLDYCHKQLLDRMRELLDKHEPSTNEEEKQSGLGMKAGKHPARPKGQ